MKSRRYTLSGSTLALAACLLASSALHAQTPDGQAQGQDKQKGQKPADKDPRAPAGRPPGLPNPAFLWASPPPS